MTTILAIDPARLTGFAHSCGERGTWDLGPGPAVNNLFDCVMHLHRREPFTILAAENAAQGSHNFAVQGFHAEFRGVLRLAADQLGCEFVLINPASLKAWSTGSGRAKKGDMIRAAKVQFGLTIESDDEADAFWILKYVEAKQHIKAAESNHRAVKRKEKIRKKKEKKLF